MRGVRATTLAAVVTIAACGGGQEAGDLVTRGDALFHGAATCPVCHGPDLRGTTMGPPLLDALYVPSHHPDAAIRAAIEHGVAPHHWDFGPMPALTHIDDEDIDALIAYIRAQQQAAGIE